MACPPEQIGGVSHYAPAQDLLAEIRRSQKLRQVTPKLARMLLAIAEGYSRKPNWRGYSYREDMVASAMPFLCTAVFKFKVKKNTSAFSYLTRTAHNAFLQTLKKESKHARLNQLIREHVEVSSWGG